MSATLVVVRRVSPHIRVDRGRERRKAESAERHRARTAIPCEDRTGDEAGVHRVVDVILRSVLHREPVCVSVRMRQPCQFLRTHISTRGPTRDSRLQ